MFGGNSNWRGPVWMPINYLLIEALYEFEAFYGKDIVIELPTGSGNDASLAEVAAELSRRVTKLFLKDGDGHRPVLGHSALLQDDPHFRDLIPFHEYFHGETGAGLGAAAPDRLDRAGRAAAPAAEGVGVERRAYRRACAPRTLEPGVHR